MAIYDSYQQANSQAIPQFVGSALPEIKEISRDARARYEAAAETDDRLVEAMGNLQHLSLEGDTQYAEELKKHYLAKLEERANRGDYENLGRRTQQDAVRFAQEYIPLAQRQQAMQQSVQKIQEDKDIFSEDTKNRLIQKLQYQNSARRGIDGDFERDAAGRIKLNPIQGIAYAKDVDHVKKLTDFLKNVEVQVRQGGFVADGKGLKISTIEELRDPAKLAQLGRVFMQTDPEIRAMMERDVDLATFNLSAGDYRSAGTQTNRSEYSKMKGAGYSDRQIAEVAAHMGMSMEQMKSNPVDSLIASGMDEAEAYERVYKSEVRKGLYDGAIGLVAEALKVDKVTLQARTDADYAASAAASISKVKANDIMFMETGRFDIQANKGRDQEDIENELSNHVERMNILKGDVSNLVGAATGLRLDVNADKEQYRATKEQLDQIVNNPDRVRNLIARLKEGSTEDKDLAAALEVGNDKLIAARQQENILAEQAYIRKFGDDPTAMSGYSTILPMDKTGMAAQLTGRLNEQLRNNSLDAIDVSTGRKLGDQLLEEYGKGWFSKDLDSKSSKEKLAASEITLTGNFVDGKPVAIFTGYDGSQRPIVLNSVDPELVKEILANGAAAIANKRSSSASIKQMDRIKMSYGEANLMGITKGGLMRLEPSAEVITLSPSSSARVKVMTRNGQKFYRLGSANLQGKITWDNWYGEGEINNMMRDFGELSLLIDTGNEPSMKKTISDIE